VAGGSGPGAETVGREVALERGAGKELVTGEQTRDSVTFERLGRRRGRERKRRGERGSGRGGATRHGGSVGPGPDRVLADCDPGTARSGGASLFGQRRAGR
jgi:hypothetical protein